MYKALKKVYDAIPEGINVKDYCFYIGSGWKNPPKKYKGIKVYVVYIIEPRQIYFSPKWIFFNEP